MLKFNDREKTCSNFTKKVKTHEVVRNHSLLLLRNEEMVGFKRLTVTLKTAKKLRVEGLKGQRNNHTVTLF